MQPSQEWTTAEGFDLHLGSLPVGIFEIEISEKISGDEWSPPRKMLRIEVNQPFYRNPMVIFLGAFALLTLLTFLWYNGEFLPNLNRRQKLEEQSAMVWKEEQSAFVESALGTLEHLLATDQNEKGIQFASRFRRFYSRFLSFTRPQEHSLSKEWELTTHYLEIVNSGEGHEARIFLEPEVAVGMEKIGVPSLLFVKTLDLAIRCFSGKEFHISNLRIGIAEISKMLQFTIETDPGIETEVLSGQLVFFYETRKQHLENVVANWNEMKKNKLEFHAPDVVENHLKGHRFQIWLFTRN